MQVITETLLESSTDYNEATHWHLYYAELLVKQKRQNKFSIDMHIIPHVKPRTWGVFLVPR